MHNKPEILIVDDDINRLEEVETGLYETGRRNRFNP